MGIDPSSRNMLRKIALQKVRVWVTNYAYKQIIADANVKHVVRDSHFFLKYAEH